MVVMNNPNHRRQEAYVYRSTLNIRYMMNDTWIARLGPRDKEVPNPHHRSGPPASLYRVARVEAFLETYADEFADHLARRAKRAATMNAVAEMKRRELLDWAESVEIQHFSWPDDLSRACGRHLQALFMAGMAHGVPDVTPRTILNMLRHACTDYESLLAQADGKVGAGEAYGIIKRRINGELTVPLLNRGISLE